MSFRSVFIAVFLGTALILAALILNHQRPRHETQQPNAAAVRATGKCASCHLNETSAIVHQFEMSTHAAKGVTCLDCHRVAENQQALDHRGFEITTDVTAKNCAQCHPTQYDQFLKSRHGAPAWAAVMGSEPFTQEQIDYAETYHPKAVARGANKLAQLEGAGAIEKGCQTCHAIGKPNADGSIGSCTECHARHSTSIELAREPSTCGQCHMGPDHSQIEIYNESKHGVLYKAQKAHINLSADPKSLTTRDIPVPNCATCHMSGLEGMKTTHDVTERLSYCLFAPISEKRPTYAQGQAQMKEVCLKCHASKSVEAFYKDAEVVVASTNEKVTEIKQLMDELYDEGLLTPEPFDEPMEFMYFDYWHYFGRTAKHGAFMGGADFVQWHGNYELLLMKVEMEEEAERLRRGHD